MEKRILGSGGLEVSALGFGCMGMTQSFGPNPGDRGQMMNLRWSTCPAASPRARKPSPPRSRWPGCSPSGRGSALSPTRRLERLQENLGALEAQLAPGDLAAIENAAAEITVTGARYPEAMQQMIDR